MTDTRQPSKFSVQALEKWETATPGERIGICVRIRSEQFLDYPQADAEAFKKMVAHCRELPSVGL